MDSLPIALYTPILAAIKMLAKFLWCCQTCEGLRGSKPNSPREPYAAVAKQMPASPSLSLFHPLLTPPQRHCSFGLVEERYIHPGLDWLVLVLLLVSTPSFAWMDFVLLRVGFPLILLRIRLHLQIWIHPSRSRPGFVCSFIGDNSFLWLDVSSSSHGWILSLFYHEFLCRY